MALYKYVYDYDYDYDFAKRCIFTERDPIGDSCSIVQNY